MWRPTVRTLTSSAAAISRLESPAARSPSTSTSRGVRPLGRQAAAAPDPANPGLAATRTPRVRPVVGWWWGWLRRGSCSIAMPYVRVPLQLCTLEGRCGARRLPAVHRRSIAVAPARPAALEHQEGAREHLLCQVHPLAGRTFRRGSKGRVRLHHPRWAVRPERLGEAHDIARAERHQLGVRDETHLPPPLLVPNCGNGARAAAVHPNQAGPPHGRAPPHGQAPPLHPSGRRRRQPPRCHAWDGDAEQIASGAPPSSLAHPLLG